MQFPCSSLEQQVWARRQRVSNFGLEGSASSGMSLATSPKGKGIDAAKSAVYIKTARVKLEDISLAESSGWRPVNAQRVKELEEVVLSGNFGSTILAKPSVLCNSDGEATKRAQLCVYVHACRRLRLVQCALWHMWAMGLPGGSWSPHP